MSVEFWFEFASTYSYPAAMRIEQAAAARGLAIAWRPFLLGPIFAAQGWTDSPFNIYPAKGRYMWRDLERRCADHGLPFRRPSQFPRNGLLPARVACAADGEPWLPEFVRHVYLANFAKDCDIANRDTVGELLVRLGLPGESLLDRAEHAETKRRLRERTEEAGRRGIFGAPSFFVGDELFWGDDRLEDALDWAVRHAN